MNIRKKWELRKLKKMMETDMVIFGSKTLGMKSINIGKKSMKFFVGHELGSSDNLPYSRFDELYDDMHHKFRFRELIPDMEYEFKFIVEAYLANAAALINNEHAINKLLPTEYGTQGERMSLEHSYIEVRNKKDIKFIWCISKKIELSVAQIITRNSMIQQKLQPDICKDYNQFTLFESYKAIGELGSRIYVKPQQDKMRQKLHKMIISHPYFDIINKAWIKETGHELNWFKYPTSAISGQIVWDGKKYIHQDAGHGTGYFLSFTDNTDGEFVIPRKFAS